MGVYGVCDSPAIPDQTACWDWDSSGQEEERECHIFHRKMLSKREEQPGGCEDSGSQ